jgi:hypothetical protein
MLDRMPDSKPDPQKSRPEFEVAYYTKELGKPLQREMLQRQLALLGDSSPAPSRQPGGVEPQGPSDSAAAQDA